MIADALDWLRADLAADRDRLASMTLGDAIRGFVDTLLAPALVARTTIYACTYAINHAERGAETTYSVFDAPIRADCWRDSDEIQAGILTALPVGLFATPFASIPSDPLVALVVAHQLGVLLASPALALLEVAR